MMLLRHSDDVPISILDEFTAIQPPGTVYDYHRGTERIEVVVVLHRGRVYRVFRVGELKREKEKRELIERDGPHWQYEGVRKHPKWRVVHRDFALERLPSAVEGQSIRNWLHPLTSVARSHTETFRVVEVELPDDKWFASHTPMAKDLGNVSPGRVETTTYRVLRDTKLARTLKQVHEHKCQICGETIGTNERPYSEAHHLKPLGMPHNGPDLPGNILVLCPNHHAMCDMGLIRLSLKDLRVHAQHTVEDEYLDYHNQMAIARSDAMAEDSTGIEHTD